MAAEATTGRFKHPYEVRISWEGGREGVTTVVAMSLWEALRRAAKGDVGVDTGVSLIWVPKGGVVTAWVDVVAVEGEEMPF